MKITKIEKKKRLYLLELDESDKLYVTEDTLVRFMLSKGMDISTEQLEEIKTFAQFSYGKNLALYYISFKARTSKEVMDYLYQHEIDSQIIPQVIKNLQEDKWLNDSKYIESYLESALWNGDKGPYVLKQKLSLKGLDKKLIDQQLLELDFSDLAQKTASKLQRKYASKLSQKALRDKIIQGLSNKGFSFEEAKRATSQLDWEADEELEAELLYKEMDKVHRKYSRKYEGYELSQRMTQALARKGFAFDQIRSALRDFL